jgi:glycosyltransferase involved in cell wall biosynthesis
MEKNNRICVVLPAYNEEITIGSIIAKCKKYTDNVIVVDDGSTDSTYEISQSCGATVIKNAQNLGKGAAIKVAFNHVKTLDMDVIVILDADGQHNPEDIPKIVSPILNKEADMVIGSRFVNKEQYENIPKQRRFGNKVLTFVSNLGEEIKITDTQSGFRAFSKKSIEIFKFDQKSMNIESEMLDDAKNAKLIIKEVPIGCKYDGLDTSTEGSIYHGFGVLNYILKIVRKKHPLLFFGLPGLISLIIGLFLGAWTMSGYYSTGSFWVGKAMVSVLFVLTGVLFIFSALIMDSINNIMKR